MTDDRLVLITGGAGFLGAHLAQAFRSSNTRVRLLDSTECPAWAAQEHVEYMRGDVRSPEVVTAAAAGATAIVHAAFASPRQTSAVIRAVNVGGTSHVCEAARRHRIRRVVLISSTLVTGLPRPHPLWRESPLSRLDLYRTTRIDAERIVLDSEGAGTSVAIVRPQSFVGAGRLGAFGIIFELIRTGGPVPVLGHGHHRYQLVGVRDLALGIRLLTHSEGTGVFAFGARTFRSVRDDLQALVTHSGSTSTLRFIPPPLGRAAFRALELLGGTPLSEWHRHSAWGQDAVADTTRAEQDLGWTPAQSNLDAMAEAYDWYSAAILETGEAARTHPLPHSHQFLKRFLWLLPGS